MTTATGDPSNTLERLDRRSARGQRADQQRAKVEAFAREQRRKRLMLGGLLVAALLALAVGVFALLPRPTAALGHQVPIEGNRQHVAQGADMPYRNRPPSSGDHYPTPAGYGVFSRDIPVGNLVHALEHGGIVVYYRPDLCDQACQDQLRQAYNTAPRSPKYGVVKMVVAPWTDMDHAVTAAAWGWVDEMDEPDAQRIVAFYREHVDRGPEDAL